MAKLSILLVEDNQVNQKVILAQLKMLGHEANLASNGSEVMPALDKNNYDLILMDCEMPIMNGFTATQLVRESNHSDIPILGITAQITDLDKCLQAGMDARLLKPCTHQQLQIVINHLITKQYESKSNPTA